ncbi:hypothetical protein WEU32_09150 [Brevundimonas sp. BH3]|uniref:hypothetical protein n=1 Tax=Brevundimonas sp. BH3 TaxID=3133089 RepID=UPI00324EC613
MKPHVRAAIVAAALSHHGKRNVSSVYDFSAGSYHNIVASFNGQSLTAFDYTKGAHFSGTIPNLFHYGESCHIQLKHKSGDKYDGFDYGSSHHFELTIKHNGQVDFFDYGAGSYFTYKG